ncbi:unnamed protein product [Rotaria sp. Silwood2]|nr:unnamed protein product [Rotaria sp. Silwood2]CAF2529135.1 unnamed protein product [Rotaria sp. Silwood2]CAF2762694.1 unnamed protein product [Rotaria sp. Silwood2]CAF2940164.1 unnamed protein product [Rotaria sp. Silwood2]CAF3850408.1 unnamed protein product [Rotaria sp. Silwood2]
MNNQLHHSIDIDLNDLESITNFNQSFNENDKHREKKKFSIKIFHNLSLYVIICLIIFSIIFFIIGIIYRNSCRSEPDIPIFLIIFSILILINLFIYRILGITFLALIRGARSCSLDKGIGILIATLFGVIFGIIIFIWWITGTIWWIKLTLRIKPQLKHPTSLACCHPIVYWTALLANIFGLIGFIIQICIAIDGSMRASKQSSKIYR